MVFALKGTKQWMTTDIENQAHQHLHILRALIYEHENKKKIRCKLQKNKKNGKNHDKIFFLQRLSIAFLLVLVYLSQTRFG